MLVFTAIFLERRANDGWLFALAQQNEAPTLVNPEPTRTARHTPTATLSASLATPGGTPQDTPLPAPVNPAVDPTLGEADLSETNLGEIDSEVPAPSLLFLSLRDGKHIHLYAYHPQTFPLTRITAGDGDDLMPAISPDGNQLAFTSNRNGYWDLYLLELSSGETVRLTNSPAYEGAPSWSPDGQWLVYESYVASPDAPPASISPTTGTTSQPSPEDNNANLDLFIQLLNTDNPVAPIRLTDHPSADYSPAWSPDGRRIAFVSNRSGEPEIWLADLDQIDGRFQNISHDQDSPDLHPSWSQDGRQLAWSTLSNGMRIIRTLQLDNPGSPTSEVGAGDWPVWGSQGQMIYSAVFAPNRSYITGYDVQQQGLALSAMPLPGSLHGLTFGRIPWQVQIPDWILPASLSQNELLWQPALTTAGQIPNGRMRVVELPDTNAPYAFLNDMADESFLALRQAVVEVTGWDFLANLENAYVPLGSPLFPGMQEDWLYTGRGIALNTAPLSAGWMVVEREDIGAQTYWRVFIRTRFQDGSQGIPLHNLPWDFNARFLGDPRAYELGGRYVADMPAGYWIDFTDLALVYGWQRLPALFTWHTAMGAARYHEFVFQDGRDWLSAMEEIYPQEALATPTIVVPPTRTSTATPRWPTRTPTPTRTPRLTRTPTPTPTQATP